MLVNHSSHSKDTKMLKSANNIDTMLNADVVVMSSYVSGTELV